MHFADRHPKQFTMSFKNLMSVILSAAKDAMKTLGTPSTATPVYANYRGTWS
jgi:hypothetical protein